MSQPVGTLVKAMDVLDALGEYAPVGVLELSRLLDMDKSAVSRILTTFKSRDFVRVNNDGRYDLGVRMFELGQAMRDRLPVREALIPHVDAIARETGETVFAMHFSQGQVAYLYDCVSTHDIRLGERSGNRAAPWHHPAGKVILAYREEDGVLESLAVARRVKRKGLPTIADFRSELASVRRHGYAEQRDTEKCLISVPVPTRGRRVNAALMLGGPAFRIKPSHTKKLAGILTRHASNAARSLGWLKQLPSEN